VDEGKDAVEGCEGRLSETDAARRDTLVTTLSSDVARTQPLSPVTRRFIAGIFQYSPERPCGAL
jgi:hypothetical protein